MSTSSSLTVRFAYNAESGSEEKNVVLQVKDISTGDSIAGATVIITGANGYSYTGLSADNGQCNLGVLRPGTYNVVTTAANYIPSNLDSIANDRFVI